MGRRAASGLQVRSRAGADANTWEATESKMMVGSETETVGVTGKSKEMTGSEVEMVAGTESGVDTEAGMDSELTVDQSRVVAGAEASARCVIVTTGADMRSTVVGTATGDGAAAVTVVRVGLIAEMTPSVCVAVSEFAAAANARLGITGAETERVG